MNGNTITFARNVPYSVRQQMFPYEKISKKAEKISFMHFANTKMIIQFGFCLSVARLIPFSVSLAVRKLSRTLWKGNIFKRTLNNAVIQLKNLMELLESENANDVIK